MPAASGRLVSRYAAPSHERAAPAPSAPIALSLPYANLFVVRIRSIDLAGHDSADGDLLGGKRHELVALEQHHWLGGHGVLGHAKFVLSCDDIGKHAIDVLDRGLERILERGALLEIVGGVDGEQLRVAIRHEAVT